MITAQTADGTIHQFPDGTPDAVVDQAIKSYVSNKPGAAAAASQPSPPRSLHALPTVLQRIESSVPGRFIQGAVLDPIEGIGQLLVHASPYLGSSEELMAGPSYADSISDAAKQGAVRDTDAAISNHEQQYQAARTATGQTGTDWARLSGNLASPTNVVLGDGLAAFKGAPYLTRLLAAAGGGAVSGATQPVTDGDFVSEKAQQAGIGSVGGAAASTAGRVLGSVISPTLPKNVATLVDKGVPLTPGQMFGGPVRTVENSLTSVPLIGDVIKNGQRNSVIGLNRAAMSDALAPIGETIPSGVGPGREGIDYVGTTIGKKYDSILPQMTAAPDTQFYGDAAKVLADAKANLPPQQFSQFKNIVSGQFGTKGSSNPIDGQTIQGIASTLKREAAGYGGDPAYDNQKLGQYIGQIHDAFTDLLGRQNPTQAPDLAAANRAWALFSRLRTAAASQGSKDGVFSAPQLAAAVRAGDKSVAKGDYAKGLALGQDLSDAGNQVLPSTVPDSGTAGRLLAAWALGGEHAAINPATGVPALGAAGLYTLPGQKLLRLAVQRPGYAGTIADLARNGGIALSPAAGAIAANSRN